MDLSLTKSWNRTFCASISKLPEVMQFVEEVATSVGFAKENIDHIQIALEEAFVNIASYAYPTGTNGEAQLICHYYCNRMLELILSDQGFPYDPLAAQRVDLQASAETRRIGGLGVFFMHKLMDEVTYRRERDCNILTLRKQNRNEN